MSSIAGLRIFRFSELGCNFSVPCTIRMTWAVFPVKWLRLILFWWLLSHVIPWVPGVFLACGGNFRCWPKADTSSDSPDSGIQIALQWENNCLCQSLLQCQFASFLTAVCYSRFKNTWLGIYELFFIKFVIIIYLALRYRDPQIVFSVWRAMRATIAFVVNMYALYVPKT